jgi:hypothetical protein
MTGRDLEAVSIARHNTETWLMLMNSEIVIAVHDKMRERLGHWVWALAAPGYLGQELLREGMTEGILEDENKMLDVQRRQIDATVGVWVAMGFEKFGSSKFRYQRVTR